MTTLSLHNMMSIIQLISVFSPIYKIIGTLLHHQIFYDKSSALKFSNAYFERTEIK